MTLSKPLLLTPLLMLNPVTSAFHDQADLLVIMRSSGKVERYDAKTGKWKGTLIYGVTNPTALAWGPDGNLYITTGALNGPGKVNRYHGLTGAFLGDFVAHAEGQPGFLKRGTGLAFHDDDLFVASCDDGRIVRFDGQTGACKGDFATGSVGGITQIRFHEGKLYTADFHAASIRQYDARTGQALGALTTLPGFCPWGLCFDAEGRLLWSGSNNTIQKYDGKANSTWAGETPKLATPLWLEVGPDGRLYCSDWSGNCVHVFESASADKGQPALRITGPEVRGPIGLAFTTQPMPERRSLRIGDWGDKPLGRPTVRVEALSDAVIITHIGWDSEGGDRARHNLLRAPLEVRLQIGEAWRSVNELPAQCRRRGDTLRYRLAVSDRLLLGWHLSASKGSLWMRFTAEGEQASSVRALQLVFHFDPHIAATTVLGADWTLDGKTRFPSLVLAPDLGQMRLSCPGHPEVTGRLEGSRIEQWADFTLDLPAPGASGCIVEFEPVNLPRPKGFSDSKRWAMARRGWFNLLQVNAGRQAEGSCPPMPPGVWTNNVLSDPVGSTVFWLGDHVLLVPELAPGIPVAPLLRRSVELWMNEKISPEGQVYYVVAGGNAFDSNPAVLIAAWCYVEAANDVEWLQRNIERLEFVARFMEQRDVDGDGLIESRQSGNRGTHAFGDTACDTYSSGWKNGYVNALAYRAFRSLADLESRLGRDDRATHYRSLAERLKASYVKTFYNPETGWLGWWRSQDGMLHEVHSDLVTDLAIMHGLVDIEKGREMLDKYWAALQASGFQRFDLGVPLNIKPVHRDDQCGEWGGKKEDGSDTFGKYLNGGCCVSNTYFFLVANYIVGNTERADRVLDAMLERQHRGFFPNGGGFQNGIVDRYPDGAEFYDWQGNTCGYEGHLVYSWTFLQAMLLREPRLREKAFRPLRP